MRTLICAVNQDAEKAFKKTVEMDRLIDMLREANPNHLQKLVVENILAFNESFWIRLVARSDTCISDDDKKDYEELATAIMSIVDCVVHKTHEKIDSATDVLNEILKPVVDEEKEIPWPPKDPEALKQMEKQIFQMEQEGQLDEGNEVLKAEQFFETVIKAPEQEWNKLLIDGLAVGKGEVAPGDFYAVFNKRIEQTLIRTVRGTLCLEFLLAVDSTLF
ncbi:hypothetical protein REPUB_Repub04eG0052500 [Reevesia pubescens]